MKNKKQKQRYWINGKAYRKVYVIRACFKAIGLMPYKSKEDLVEAIRKDHSGMTGTLDDVIVQYACKLDEEGIPIGRSLRKTKLPLVVKRNVKPQFDSSSSSFPVNFYASREWRELRYLALRNTCGRCQCCGATSKDGVRIHVDHIKPRSMFPELSLCLNNLQVLCEDCNIGKGCWDITDWRQHA